MYLSHISSITVKNNFAGSEVIFMIENDTIRLLRECDAGIKMGITSLKGTMKYVNNKDLKSKLRSSMDTNNRIKSDILSMLKDYHDDGKEPPLIAKGMTWLKTNTHLMANNSSSSIASLITDGCNMGVKSITKYMNKYSDANEKTKHIAKRLISAEEHLAADMRQYL